MLAAATYRVVGQCGGSCNQERRGARSASAPGRNVVVIRVPVRRVWFAGSAPIHRRGGDDERGAGGDFIPRCSEQEKSGSLRKECLTPRRCEGMSGVRRDLAEPNCKKRTSPEDRCRCRFLHQAAAVGFDGLRADAARDGSLRVASRSARQAQHFALRGPERGRRKCLSAGDDRRRTGAGTDGSRSSLRRLRFAQL